MRKRPIPRYHALVAKPDFPVHFYYINEQDQETEEQVTPNDFDVEIVQDLLWAGAKMRLKDFFMLESLGYRFEMGLPREMH